jgi:hypothetical protein
MVDFAGNPYMRDPRYQLTPAAVPEGGTGPAFPGDAISLGSSPNTLPPTIDPLTELPWLNSGRTSVPDFFALNPYLRRYQLTPEQQQEYDRYVVSKMRTDADINQSGMQGRPLSVDPVPDAGRTEATPFAVQPSARPFAPRAVQLAGADGPSPQDDSAAGATSPAPETPPSGMSDPTPSPGFAQRAGSAVSHAAADAIDWVATRGNEKAANILGMPRLAPDAIGWAAEKTGLPRAVVTPPMLLPQEMWRWIFPELYDRLPYPDEIKTVLAKNPWLAGPVMAPALYYARMVKGGDRTPEVNLPGKWGKIVDAGIEAALPLPIPGNVGPKAMGLRAAAGSGFEGARQAAHGYDETHGTNWEDRMRYFGNLIGLMPGSR